MSKEKSSTPTDVKDMAPVILSRAFSVAIRTIPIPPVVKIGAVSAMVSGAAVSGVGSCVKSSHAKSVGSGLYNVGKAVDELLAGKDMKDNLYVLYKEASGAVGYTCRLVGLGGDNKEQVIEQALELAPE